MSKHIYHKSFGIALISFLTLISFCVSAQAPAIDSLLIKAFATDELLPQLIDSAIKNSPEVIRIQNTLDYAKDEAKINKNNIYSGLSLLSSYNYGTNFSAITNPSGTIGNNSFTKAQTGYYNVGVGVQLPLSLILNRKSMIHAENALVKATASEKEKAALFVKQEVIRVYQELKLSQRLIIISSKNKQAAQINYEMAEKNFVQGQTGVAEITGIQDILNKSNIEFETDVNRFQTNYMQLEAYTGVDLYMLIKQVK